MSTNHFIHNQIFNLQPKLTKKQLKNEQKRMKLFKQNQFEKKREPFAELLNGTVISEEKAIELQRLHQEFKSQGYYISLFEKNQQGFNLQPKEFKDTYYIPIPKIMNNIKRFNRNKHDKFESSEKDFKMMLKYSFMEIRSGYLRSEFDNEIQKLILGKYSFERYVNYVQRVFVSSPTSKYINFDEIDTTKVPVPSFPIIPVLYEGEQIDCFIPRNTPVSSKELDSYSTTESFYVSVIDWCRHYCQYDDSEVLKIAFRKLLGNEIKYKDCLQDYKEMGKFIRACNNEFRYKMKYHKGNMEAYRKDLIDSFKMNGRLDIMKRTTRILNLWKYPKFVGNIIYKKLQQIRTRDIIDMCENPKMYLSWLNEAICDTRVVYDQESVSATIRHFGYYQF